jgi:ribosomal protein L29
MKSKDIKALSELSVEKLNAKKAELSAEFSKARMEHRVGRLKNVRILGQLRDDLARVMTVLQAKKEVKA